MATATDISILERRSGNRARRTRRGGCAVGGKIPQWCMAGQRVRPHGGRSAQVLRILKSESGHKRFSTWRSTGSGEGDDREWQSSPSRETLLHVDLKGIAMDKKLTSRFRWCSKSEAIGIRRGRHSRAVGCARSRYECLPRTSQKYRSGHSATSCRYRVRVKVFRIARS